MSLVLLEQLLGVEGELLEEVVVAQVSHDLLSVQVNEHTSDLGGLWWSNNLLDEVKDHSSNLILVLLVLWDNRWDESLSLGLVGSDSLVDWSWLLLGLSALLHLLLGSHLLLLLWSHVELLGVLLLHHVHLHVHLLLLLLLLLRVLLHELLLLLHHLHWVLHMIGMWHWDSSLGSLVLVHWASLSELWSGLWSLVEEGAGESWVGQERSEDGVQVLSVDGVRDLSTSGVLVQVLLEVSVVFHGLVLDLSELLDLVVVDVELSVTESGSVQGVLSVGGSVWGLVADESVDVLLLLILKHLDLLDFTIVLELGDEFFLAHGWVEVLDVEIASLLGVLVSEHFSGLLQFSVSFLESLSAVELQVAAHVSSVEFLDSLAGRLGSNGWVLSLLVAEADEGVGTLVVLLDDAAVDLSVWGEEFLDLVFGPGVWEVLAVDVVEGFSVVSSVLGLVLQKLDFAVGSESLGDSLGGRFFVLETDESVGS